MLILNNNILIIGRVTDEMIKDIQLLELNVILITSEQEVNLVRDRDVLLDLLVFDYTQLDQLMNSSRILLKKYGIQAAFSFSEEALFNTAFIAEFFNLKGNDIDSVRKTQNKYLMRRILANHKEFSLPYKLVKTIDDIGSFVEENGKSVLKPIGAYASKGVIEVNKGENYNNALKYTNCYGSEILIEKYIYGRSFSIDILSLNGSHDILVILERKISEAPYYVTTAYTNDFDLSKETLGLIKDYCFKILNTLNIQQGISHIEIKLENNQPKLIELQMRPGGRMHKIITYVSGEKILPKYIASVLDMPYSFVPVDNKVSVFFFYSNVKGCIISVKGINNILSNKSVVFLTSKMKIGTQINRIQSTKDRLGYFIHCKRNMENQSKKCYKEGLYLLNQLEIEVESI